MLYQKKYINYKSGFILFEHLVLLALSINAGPVCSSFTNNIMLVLNFVAGKAKIFTISMTPLSTYCKKARIILKQPSSYFPIFTAWLLWQQQVMWAGLLVTRPFTDHVIDMWSNQGRVQVL